MDDNRFDALVKMFGNGASRRSILKGLFGLGGAAVAGGVAVDQADARTIGTRPTIPPPTTPSCVLPRQLCGGVCCDSGKCKNGHCCLNATDVWCGNACCVTGLCTTDGNCCPAGYKVCGTECCAGTTSCARSGNTDFCCDPGAGNFPCGLECCDDEHQCCDLECCSDGAVCLTSVFGGESNLIEEEECCPIDLTCDGRCCDGTCFNPADTSGELPLLDGILNAGFSCCPAGHTVCPGSEGANCCGGETPQCCVREGVSTCIAARACCADDDCIGCQVCDQGTCRDEHGECDPGCNCLAGTCICPTTTTTTTAVPVTTTTSSCLAAGATVNCPSSGISAQCCAGCCDFVAQVCKSGLGSICTSSSQCCSGFCNGVVCAQSTTTTQAPPATTTTSCLAAGATVNCPSNGVTAQCCAGCCDFVVQVCKAGLGSICSSSSQCCSGFCNGVVCAQPTTSPPPTTQPPPPTTPPPCTCGIGELCCPSGTGGFTCCSFSTPNCCGGQCMAAASCPCASDQDCTGLVMGQCCRPVCDQIGVCRAVDTPALCGAGSTCFGCFCLPNPVP